ncbi:MAG: DUF2799 domain-containing protein [Burkholderiales bacterium]|nr:DUF2799 domain-containing protein [Burkholderiales bacterium]MBK8664575.1 DUF2799 domain-containing protein [Burkholderiales bacterium]
MNPRSYTMAVLALSVTLVVGCASMTEEQCRTANWLALGQADARNGEMPDFGAARVQNCREKGVVGNLDEWRQGWERGRREVCTPGNASAWAQRERDYTPGFCPPELEPAFMSIYAPARERYKFEKRIRDLEAQLSDRSRQLSDVIRQMGRPENQTAQKQAQLAASRSALEHEMRGLRDRIRTESLLRIVR